MIQRQLKERTGNLFLHILKVVWRNFKKSEDQEFNIFTLKLTQ